MTNEDYRLRALEMAVETIKQTKEYIEPWDRANQFYNYIMTGNPAGKPARKKPGPKPKRKK